MAIKVGQAFERTSANPIDVTLALTKAQMVAVNDNLMPTYYFTICQDDGKVYLYDKSATASVTTGKFKEFSGGGSGGSAVFETTATLKTDINDSDVILAADLPGVAFSDIIVGATLIRDSKGTVGLVTAKSGTASVVVTTATTSTPTKELTKAQYDALSQADKDNGTIYFVTDTNSSILPASSKTYSTTEQVVGTWIDGSPIYQKTWAGYQIPTFTSGDTTAARLNVPLVDGLDTVINSSVHYKDSVGQQGRLPLEDAALIIMDGKSVPSQVSYYFNKSGTTTAINITNTIPRYSGRDLIITIQYTKAS